MRSSLLLMALLSTSIPIVSSSGMTATIIDVNAVLGFDAGPGNFYNAPIPPWKPGAVPGWYYGPNPQKYPDLWCLHDFMCRFLWYYPNALHCPSPNPYPGYPAPQPTKTVTDTTTKTTTTTDTVISTVTTTTTTTATSTATVTVTQPSNPTIDGYIPTFSNFTAAVQADDFMTFGLVETVADCMAMCDSVPGCTFVNSFHDVNGKGGSTDLTCSLFKFCHTEADADNAGGQSQPDGSIDFIINSDGWCKVGNSTSGTTTVTGPTTTGLPSTTPTLTSTTSPTPSTTTTSSSTSASTTVKSTTAPTTTKSSTTTIKTTPAPSPTVTGVAHYYQCGGINYYGPTKCQTPYHCVYQNPYYSQCL